MFSRSPRDRLIHLLYGDRGFPGMANHAFQGAKVAISRPHDHPSPAIKVEFDTMAGL